MELLKVINSVFLWNYPWFSLLSNIVIELNLLLF